MESDFSKFSIRENQSQNNLQDSSIKKANSFSVKTETLEKSAEEIRANRMLMAMFATEALGSLGFAAYSLIDTLNNGFSGFTLVSLPALFFTFSGVKHMIKYYNEAIKESKKAMNSEKNNDYNEESIKL